MGSHRVPHPPGFTQLAHKLAMYQTELSKLLHQTSHHWLVPNLVHQEQNWFLSSVHRMYINCPFLLLLLCVCLSFCAKFVVYSCYLILCSGPIELCSIVVPYLGDTDIGLCHPLIVQCIHVCMMKVFRGKKKKEEEFEKERREAGDKDRRGGDRKVWSKKVERSKTM